MVMCMAMPMSLPMRVPHSLRPQKRDAPNISNPKLLACASLLKYLPHFLLRKPVVLDRMLGGVVMQVVHVAVGVELDYHQDPPGTEAGYQAAGG